MLLAKYEQKNLMVQVLSEMTGQKPETIRTKLNRERMRTVMEELNIDRQKFRDEMQVEVRKRVEKAATEGTITPDQKNEILTNMENRAQRREVMRQLIEKGLEDGTITQEQAQMIGPKRR
jgi:lipoate-protein ligase A